MSMLGTFKLKDKSFNILCISLLLATYLAQTLPNFAFADDYSFLYEVKKGNANAILEHNFAEGRYFSGIFQALGFILFADLTSLKYLRLISLIGIIILLFNLWKLVKMPSKETDTVVWISTLGLLPVFSQYLTFATTWVAPWAILSTFFATKVLIHRNRYSSRIAFLLICTGLLFSQIYPFWSFAFIGVFFLLGRITFNECMRKTLIITTFIGSAFLLQIVLGIALQKFFGVYPSERIERVEIEEIPTKVFWFLSRNIASVYRPFFIDSPTSIEALISSCLFFALGFFAYMIVGKCCEAEKRRVTLFAEILFVQILIILSLSPLLVWKQNQFEFRLIGAGSFLALSFVVLPSLQFIRQKMQNRTYLNLGIVFLVVFLSVLGVARAHTLRIEPYRVKHEYIRKNIENCQAQGEIQSISYLAPIKWPSRMLLGDYSVGTDLQMNWVPAPSIALEFYEMNKDKDLSRLIVVSREDETMRDTCTIDLQVLIENKDSKFTSSRPLWEFVKDIFAMSRSNNG